jgi:hypothetical protein
MANETLTLQCGVLQDRKANERGIKEQKLAGVDVNIRHPMIITGIPECNEHETLKGYTSRAAAP